MSGVAPAVAPIRLKRGGVVVPTSIGPVQFGAPPETIKDALSSALQVPSVYVLPEVWFDRRRGRTLAELEFPTFYNFFLHGRSTTVVCDADGRRRLLSILRQALLGPEQYRVDHDYAPWVPPEARADLAAECRWFRRRRGAGKVGPEMELDDLVDFALYDEGGRARLGAVEIQRVHGTDGPVGWQLFDRGRLVATVDESDETSSVGPASTPPVAAPFSPPPFGVTVLGSSHGFDPVGKTTGFVVWVGRRGILVDPPCDTTDILQAAGVPARQVDAVILTHCHADHDAGVFQKVLEEGRVSLYTTPTILASFLTKCVALTGETEEQLRRLFVFRPVTIGARQRIHGAEFRFFYSLHSIPTIGFECHREGKSLVYSADTLWDPERIEEMHAAGLLSAARRDDLVNFPWYPSLVLHEAGIPPVHTPLARLAALPRAVRERMRLMHIAADNVPADTGLKIARAGFEHTIELSGEESPHAAALEVLDALLGIELFHQLPIARAREFLTIARRESLPAGALVISQGQAGDRFYLIVHGEVEVVKDGAVVKTYRDGDFFGEAALVTGDPRSADVRAKSALEVLTIDRCDFLSFLRDTELADALVRLARNRDLPSWDLMGDNAILRALSAAQRTQLQALLEPITLQAGDPLWSPGAEGESAWLLDSAAVEFRDHGGRGVVLGRAAFIGDVEGILREHPAGTARGAPASRPLVENAISPRAEVVRSGTAFRISGAALATFLRNNPGILLSLSGSLFVD